MMGSRPLTLHHFSVMLLGMYVRPSFLINIHDGGQDVGHRRMNNTFIHYYFFIWVFRWIQFSNNFNNYPLPFSVLEKIYSHRRGTFTLSKHNFIMKPGNCSCHTEEREINTVEKYHHQLIGAKKSKTNYV